jgi:diadenosine tetraphosphate (Ap4A) HIT family hydrolase
MTTFTLDPRLAADSLLIGASTLSQLRLMNDARYPWVLLIPMRANLREVHELPPDERQQLWQESAVLGETLMRLYAGHKLNLAALGNLVPQLHLHHIVRYPHDDAWPGPVWGRHPAQPYAPAIAATRVAELWAALQPGLSRL